MFYTVRKMLLKKNSVKNYQYIITIWVTNCNQTRTPLLVWLLHH